MHLLGIEIGGTKLQVVAGTPTGTVSERRRFDVDPGGGGAGIRASIASCLPDLLSRWRPAAMGVGFGGPVDFRTGRIACSHQVAGWSGFPLRDWLAEQAGIPVVVDNDANVATLGESIRGAGAGVDPVFYTTLGSGVGGGLVAGGMIYHGATPGESELGHLRLDRSGRIVEQHCSGWAVDRRIREAIASGTPTMLATLCRGMHGGEARHLAAAVAQADPVGCRILDDVAGDLAWALSHVVHLFHPGMLILGGGLALVGESLRSSVARQLEPWIMESFRPPPPVRLAALLEDAVPTGALLLAASLSPLLQPLPQKAARG